MLNKGQSTTELALNIGKRLATLSLKDADASNAADKDMINALVLEEMGTFEAMDEILREHVSLALQTCQEHVDEDFNGMFKGLRKTAQV